MSQASTAPLCVDLDGTLIKTDSLYESFLRMVKNNPLKIFAAPFWLVMGKAHFKAKISENAQMDASSLPYNEEFLAYLKEERQSGRKLVLATAANSTIANAVSKHLGIFSETFASNDKHNLKGKNKSQLLIEKYGEKQFDYAGDSRADLDVWKSANQAILVNAASSVRSSVANEMIAKEFGPQRTGLKPYFKAIRVHQWSKNVLIFLPLLLAGGSSSPEVWLSTVLAFISFSLCASSIYIWNDLLDLEADRAHPIKQFRPFAAGTIPIQQGILMAPCLLLLGLLVSLSINTSFIAVIFTYLFITTVYSFYLKKVTIADVITLACLYTVRIFAGGVAAEVPVSHWLLVLSMFLFLSLAFVKRVSELKLLLSRLSRSEIEERKISASGRDYSVEDVNLLRSMGTASGYMSILVFALYINSDNVSTLYKHPEYLWLACPLLLYWVSRVWMLTDRGQMHNDPITFAITDKMSYIVGLVCGVIWLAAKL